MLKRVLIANRGEIAVRIIRACRELDIETVAVYSTADAQSLPVQLATRAVCIGPPRAADSYLNQTAVLTAAVESGCDGVHPGYGFLSENADFADLCTRCGLKFIGPSGDVIRRMGNKAAARALMQSAGVPVVPGSDGPVPDAETAAQVAEKIGYPVLLKASAGGGGRGMRRVYDPENLISAFEEARAEAVACFGDGEMYLEKLILNPRHIEFQILADSQGNVVHLGERDCSIQRRNQKLMEESPSRALTDELRTRMGRDAAQAARACGYEGAGTVEFVLDSAGNYYFIEMNTRIQVEHPITEMVTGLDLVREQLRIAAGLELPVQQEQVNLTGHAIEVRVNAEDPAHDFRPAPGVTRFLHLPGGCGVRVDTALYNGCELSPWYDSLAAKVIVHAPTRLQAIRRMRRALEELVVEGYPTGADLAHMILYHPDYLKGEYDTGFLAQNLENLLRLSRVEEASE
ncbi:acetyl-CoA carboxylase biotin carboxylase subunit [Gemmiger formicilis]|uniref:acetyl-CoA carboxylase biotin carboxylase subunit n=1 Tax=Gemmiger formicilis TaxID=745368 RepID=UPI0019589744|nr:acetyl-CoA carboxylase biotin carboxylase subunit [Gemmiger formicilis]MBM6914911.1 acetyl-CoA carboxylase biotin carboxylase subunit [Gemmiger formicilis]